MKEGEGVHNQRGASDSAAQGTDSLALSGRCETCAFWKFDEPDWEFDELRFGECKAIRMRGEIENEAVRDFLCHIAGKDLAA